MAGRAVTRRARGGRPAPEAAPGWLQRHRGLVRQVTVGVTAVGLVGLFWRSHLQWTPDMRLWKAVGDTALVLLFLSLAMGPAGRLSRIAAAALPWRRAVGVWAAVASLTHGGLVLWGWVQFDLGRLMGYEFVPQLGRTARLEPGFGLANLMGIVALSWLLVMAGTSSDWAVRRLGPAAWKWLHSSAHVVFYLVALHSAYFLFIHYTASFHKAVPEPNWFRVPVVVMAAGVLGLQLLAFLVTRARRAGSTRGRAATA